jgi:5-methyltetrahydrofolate--homocysteine methyltransferase
MADFLQTLRSGRVLLMDGAMGTELQRAGIQPGECYELWNLSYPEKVRAIHRAYVDAGSEVVLTNTFQANSARFSQLAIADRLAAVHEAALNLARDAAGAERYVLFDVGPYLEEHDRWPAATSAPPVTGLNADGLLVETCSDMADVARILKMASRLGTGRTDALPVLLSWTFRRRPNGTLRTFKGASPKTCAEKSAKLDPAALGVNCGRDIDLDTVIQIIRQYRDHTDLPLFARPNAGTPKRVGGHWLYPLTPDDLAGRLPELLEAGVSMIGGCCGTTPEHIRACRPVITGWNNRRARRGSSRIGRSGSIGSAGL